MNHGLPRWAHRHLSRCAAPDSGRSLRSARVPPVNYLDKPPSNEPGSGFNRQKRTKWVKIQPALTPEIRVQRNARVIQVTNRTFYRGSLIERAPRG